MDFGAPTQTAGHIIGRVRAGLKDPAQQGPANPASGLERINLAASNERRQFCPSCHLNLDELMLRKPLLLLCDGRIRVWRELPGSEQQPAPTAMRPPVAGLEA